MPCCCPFNRPFVAVDGHGRADIGGRRSVVSAGGGDESDQLGLLSADRFWDGESWDGPNRNAGDLIEPRATCAGCPMLEYLNNGSGNYTPFRFTDEIFGLNKIFGVTAWSNGTLSRSGDVFVYDNGAGNVYNSWDNPGQFALFRLVGGESITYFLGVEDIDINALLNDRDYNDYGATFTTPRPVPEPGTLLLLGSGVAALAARRKLSARKAQRPIAS